MMRGAGWQLAWFDWIAGASLHAAVMIGVLLVVRVVARGRVPASILCAGWLLVLLRLAMPVVVRSPLSVYALFDGPVASARNFDRREAEAVRADSATEEAPPSLAPPDALVSSPKAALPLAPMTSLRRAGGAVRTSYWLLLWSLGAAIVTTLVVASSRRALRRLAGARPVDDCALASIVGDCAANLGVTVPIEVVELAGFSSPAVVGVLRPRLVLPASFLTHHDAEQQRHVVLHELAHMRRFDTLVGYFASLALVLHWFNPFVWVAVRCLRHDREVACDALALQVLSPDQHRRYGLSLLRMIEHASRPTGQPTTAFVVEERGSLERRMAAIARYQPAPVARVILLGAALLTVACATMSAPYEAPVQERASPGSTSARSTGAAPGGTLAGRWRVVRLDVKGAQAGQSDFALVVSSKYPPPDGRPTHIGMNGMVYIRERSMSFSDAWITDGRLDLWWEAGPDRGVLPTFTAWAGEGELNEQEGAFRFTDWARSVVFHRNPDGTMTFAIPWTRTTATIERAEEPRMRNDLHVSAQVLLFDDEKPPAPEPIARPRATLLWERSDGGAVSTDDQALSFGASSKLARATFAIERTGPPETPLVNAVGTVRFALAHLVVYDDLDHTQHLEHPLVGKKAGRDVVRAISNVAILWQGPEPRDAAAPNDSFADTWPGYELVTIGPDARARSGHTPWVTPKDRGILPETAGALPADPEHPLPFTVAVQERPVVHDLPRLLPK